MTPAINAANKANINFKIHQYEHDATAKSYGYEASEKMGVSSRKVYKTLVVCLDQNEFTVGLVPVSSLLSMKKIAKSANAKKAVMADKQDVERLTGYVLGGVSPLGQKKKLKILIDKTAEKLTSIFVSAGRRGLEIELHPDDLQKLTSGIYTDICQ